MKLQHILTFSLIFSVLLSTYLPYARFHIGNSINSTPLSTYPDLIVCGIELSPPPPYCVGDTITVLICIKNQGPVSTVHWGSFYVKLLVVGEYVEYLNIDAINTGETVYKSFAFTPVNPGWHTICVYVDYGDFIPESNEANNEVCIDFFVDSCDEYPVHNLDSGLNYTSIQGAINAPETLNGHTIFVEEGHYYENVVTSKSISLVGENRNSTIIDGNYTGHVIDVKSSNVTIRGFTVQRSGFSYLENGIHAKAQSHVNISFNIIRDNYGGVELNEVINCTVVGNLLQNNTGLGAPCGLRIENSNNLLITGNVAIQNGYCGIFLFNSTNAVLRDNKMINNTFNFYAGGQILPHFLNDIDISNTVDGKAIYYLINQSNVLIDSVTFPNIGHLALVNSKSIIVRNLEISNTHSLLLAFTNDSIVENVEISEMSYGIYLINSKNCTISKSQVESNLFYGIRLLNSYECDVVENHLSKMYYGIDVDDSYNVRIIRNQMCNISKVAAISLFRSDSCQIINNNAIQMVKRGIRLSYSEHNTLVHNNFVNGSCDTSSNIWDNGLEGNYWGNYNGTDSDSDGIGETLYVIAPNNTDNYPLMGISHSFSTALEKDVNIISNSTIENLDYFESNSTIKIFVSNVTANQTHGFCRFTIPHDVLSPPYTVLIDYGIITHTTIFENDTLSVIYFSYPHSEFKIIIIPEFPSFFILLVFMIAMLLVTIVYKKNSLQLT